VDDEPAEDEEDDDAGPEDPLVLLGPPLHHADRVAADAERIGDGIQPPLGALEHLPLLAEVAQDVPPAVEELVELVRRVLEEGILARHAALAVVVALLRAGRVCVGAVGGVGVVRGRRKGRVCGGGGLRGQRVRVLGRGGVMWTAAQQLGACFDGLLSCLLALSPSRRRDIATGGGSAPRPRSRP
jgi:hypothetical protein